LLRPFRAAQRPKAGSAPTGDDYGMEDLNHSQGRRGGFQNPKSVMLSVGKHPEANCIILAAPQNRWFSTECVCIVEAAEVLGIIRFAQDDTFSVADCITASVEARA
jgi:hypothetical protein